jgi:NADPH:quinone reductase-like Zn-dependent oxidoreductase
VLINGGGGGSGMYAVPLAKLAGAEVTGVDNTEKLEFMRSIGADHVIDYARLWCAGARRPADMAGNLAAKMATRCRAEPAGLYAAMRSAGGRICR